MTGAVSQHLLKACLCAHTAGFQQEVYSHMLRIVLMARGRVWSTHCSQVLSHDFGLAFGRPLKLATVMCGSYSSGYIPVTHKPLLWRVSSCSHT